MKKIIIALVVTLFISVSSFAQQGINYKALLKDSNDNVLANTFMSVQFSIHENSTTGTIIYQEDHNYTTDTNGLVILNIGTDATPNIGVFADINWSTDLHFLQTSITYSGGTIDFDATEFMAVPYAKHAETADNVFSGDYNDLINQPAIPSNTTYSIGDFAHGGIVFWVDPTGEHGLVCAKQNQGGGSWSPGIDGNTQAKGDGIYAGKSNTVIAISAQVAIGDNGSTYAARLCNELQNTEGGVTYGDWYLPSKFELNEMYINKVTINATAIANGGTGFTDANYWSSTEGTSTNAWLQDFATGDPYDAPKGAVVYVRAVRAF